MFGSMNYVKIWRESELECGDIAVYAAAGGTRATLIARVRAGERQERMHECIEKISRSCSKRTLRSTRCVDSQTHR